MFINKVSMPKPLKYSSLHRREEIPSFFQHPIVTGGGVGVRGISCGIYSFLIEKYKLF